jgi:hypothetical protein
MYGASLDFSGVLLPGVGGSLNASNAVTTDRLQQMNASGKKWSPDISGGLSMHNEAILKGNKANRNKRVSLVNRNFAENCDGPTAMKEIMERKKARMASFKEMKAKEYNFADDTELMSMPQPFAMGEGCGCSNKCASCRDKKRKEVEFREWDAAKRKELKKGEFAGKFAGPDMSFPIANAADVAAAWSSVGRAKNPRAIMANIIKIAKEMKLEAGLPKSVKQRLAAGESGLPS